MNQNKGNAERIMKAALEAVLPELKGTGIKAEVRATCLSSFELNAHEIILSFEDRGLVVCYDDFLELGDEREMINRRASEVRGILGEIKELIARSARGEIR